MQISSIGIIGFGSFGQFVFSLAQEKFPDLEVRVSSTHNSPDGKKFFSLEEVCKADLLVLCVPISAYKDTIEKIVPLVGQNTLVCDIATVKKYTAELLRGQKIPHYISIHPMFGPYSYAKHGNSLAGLRMVICDSSLKEDERAEVISFFKNLGMQVLEMTADVHDKLSAETLFLTHLVGQSVKKANFKRTELDTLSFGYLMDVVESVAHDDALFHDVFTYNPYCKEVLERFEDAEQATAQSLQV